MIGPLSSPALVERQVVGVYDNRLLNVFAEALKNLNIKFAWIVNSEDGLDEISPYAKTTPVWPFSKSAMTDSSRPSIAFLAILFLTT